jgi:hypothetical protein
MSVIIWLAHAVIFLASVGLLWTLGLGYGAAMVYWRWKGFIVPDTHAFGAGS